MITEDQHRFQYKGISNIRLRDLAFFHHDVPKGVAFAAEDQVHVAPVRLIILKAAVIFDKLYKTFFKHGFVYSCISASSSASDLAESSFSA